VVVCLNFCWVLQAVPLNQARDFNNGIRAIYVFKVNASILLPYFVHYSSRREWQLHSEDHT
jgi:hypothetical protein